jgi:hypothetical protein
VLEEYPLENKQNRIQKTQNPAKVPSPAKKKGPDPHQNWSFMLYHITYYYHTHPVEL